MIFEEMLKEEHAQGLEEGRREGLVEDSASNAKIFLIVHPVGTYTLSPK